MLSLENNLLKIAVKKTGAELCQITSAKYNTEFMWDANPNVWSSHAPNLFPIICTLKNDTYIVEKQSYKLPKHGLIRNNTDITLHNLSEDSLTLKLAYNEKTLNIYPFKLEFYMSYTLKDSTIIINQTVKNKDSKTIYYSVGGHPAFKCPVYDDEDYTDYFLKFEHAENSKRHLINMENGLISSRKKPVFNNSKILPLTHDMFEEDALIFKDLKSRKVTLKSKKYGALLSVSYEDFPYLGIWAKPNGNYVCIEPWLGIADHENTNQDFKTKEGILSLAPNKYATATYSIEIHNSHLV
ncbi:aldose 1-epimerase family protein [Tamlana flava]|uniref:aldose 1-epimerase family protein n=1 Tax=Tamlana flava TaxID=3158572 RepID=UPI00351AB64B